MKYYVYVTEECKSSAKSHGLGNEINELRDKIQIEQDIRSWDNFLPFPIIRKKLGTYRVLARNRIIGDDIVICMIGVFSRGSKDYDRNFLNDNLGFCDALPQPTDLELTEFIESERKKAVDVDPIPKLNAYEYDYLFGELRGVDGSDGMIFETDEWVRFIESDSGRLSRYYDVINDKIIDNDEGGTIASSFSPPVRILYKNFSTQKFTILIAPLSSPAALKTTSEDELRKKYQKIFEMSDDDLVVESLLQNSKRSYPSIMMAGDESIWQEIEVTKAGNLALSPEEGNILRSVSDPAEKGLRYPLFINGRPGSGKSTILQYLFAEHLYLHLCRKPQDRTEKPPIYLTYSSNLLEVAKDAVRTIMNCNTRLKTHEFVDISTEENRTIIDSSFADFRSFLLGLLPGDKRVLFSQENWKSYPDFRKFWNEKRPMYPDGELRCLSPEIAWHVLRSFIKGMRDESDDYFNIDTYRELPKDQKTVSEKIFQLVYEHVWDKWYKPLCTQNGWWDDQDLTRTVLNCLGNSLSSWPAIFCDEAQDFTRIELELIVNLSLFSRRMLSPIELKRVPFAFAGDPYQTLNPTGFDWDSVKAGFHEKIIKNLDRTTRGKLELHYEELSHNYRSSEHIVKFGNLIQLLRGMLFGIDDLLPQKTWFHDDAAMPAYFDLENHALQTALREQVEAIIIIPCNEGEEDEYVREDPFLADMNSTTALQRNFLSPMASKGLEFSRIVLYRFGQEMVDNYPDLLTPLNNKSGRIHSGEEALALQYYLNRLYVAASRAKKRLLIADTKQGIDGFWRNPSVVDFESLIQKYNQKSCAQWSKDELSFVQPGQTDNFDADRDNPEDIAAAFREAGISERDSYKLRLAAVNYRRISLDTTAKECEAYAEMFSGNLSEAGRLFGEINIKDKSMECFWKCRDFASLANNPQFENTIHQRAAKFKVGIQKNTTTPELIAEFFSTVASEVTQSPQIFFSNIYLDGWMQLFKDALFHIKVVDVHGQNKNRTIWRTIDESLKQLTTSGLDVDIYQGRAEVSYNAGDLHAATKFWEDIKSVNKREYLLAKASISEMPDKIIWLGRTQQYQEIVKLWRTAENTKLGPDHLGVVLESLIQQNELEMAMTLVTTDSDVELLRRIKNGATKLGNHSIAARVDAEETVKYVSSGDWEKALKKISTAVANDVSRNAFLHRVIGCLARSEELVEAPQSVKKGIAEFLRKYLIETDWSGTVSIHWAGAAIERADKIIDSLEFYEQVWREKRIPATASEIEFSRRRWLKRKYQLSEFQNSPKHKEEADRLRQQWRVAIDNLPEYPNLSETMTLSNLPESFHVNEKEDKTETAPTISSLSLIQIQIVETLLGNGMTPTDIADGMKLSIDSVEAYMNRKTETKE